MQKSIILLLFLVILNTGCHRDTKIEISGKVENGGGTSIVFEEMNVSSNVVIDSLKLGKSGKFKFKTRATFPSFFQLRNSDGDKIILLGNPGDRIRINTSVDNFNVDYTVEGSAESEKIQEFQEQLAKSVAKYDSINAIFNTIKTSDTASVWFQKKFQGILKDHKRYVISMLIADPASLSNIIGLYQMIGGEYIFNSHFDLQYFKIARDTLTKYYPRTKQVISLQADANSMLDNYNRYRLMNSTQTVEVNMPKINLPGLNGNLVSLSSLKGKYVLLNFWVSTDKNSISQNIQLKKIYKNYKRYGFEVYSVSLDSNPDAWKRAVNFDQLPWINVNDSRGLASKSAMFYNVQPPLPVSYLIDNTQETILGKNLTMKELQIKLDNLLF